MALPAEIGTGTGEQPSFSSNNYYNGPFKSSAGDFYVLSRLSGDPTQLHAWKASDPTVGSNWTVQDSANHPDVGPTFFSIDVFQDGDILHIAVGAAQSGQMTNTGYLYYGRFDMGTDSWLEFTQLTSWDFADFFFGAVSIVVRSDGDRVIFYNGPPEAVMGTDFKRIYYAIWEGSSWTTGNSLDSGGENNWEVGDCTLHQSTDNTHFIIVDNTFSTHDIFQRRLSATNSLSGLSRLAHAVRGGGPNVAPAISYVDTEVLHRVPYLANDDDGEILRFTDEATPAVSTRLVADVEPYETSDGQYVAGVINDGGDLHYLYADAATQDLWHDVNTGSGWGTDTEERDGLTINGISVNLYDRSGTKIAFAYEEGGVLFYDEIDLSTGGTTFQQSVSGAVDFQGALSKKTSISLAGSLGPSGAISKKSAKAVAGSISPQGVLTRLMFIALSGSISPSGVLDRLVGKGLSGSISPSGSLTRRTLKNFAGSLFPSGSLSRRSFKSLTGSISPSGALTTAKKFLQQLDGAVGFNGALNTNFIPGSVSALFRELLNLDTVDRNTDPRS